MIIGLNKYKPHEVQRQYWQSRARFNVIPAGRRSGKTELFKIKLSRIAALSPPGYKYFAAAPIRDQAKKIFWNDLCKFAPPGSDKRISELCIIYPQNVEVWVLGMDKPERIEGSKWNGGGLDEYGNMKAKTWPEHVRPSLADTGGWCDFLGVPEGRNHYYHLYQNALADDSGTWRAFTWHSADILPEEEIIQAKKDLDEKTFKQEYEAEFVDFAGRAYYAFSEDSHIGEYEYDPTAPLSLCFDFNVSPGVLVLIQERMIGNYSCSVIVDEIWIPENSNTPLICQKAFDRYEGHQSTFEFYGDATGESRSTSGVMGSDWDLIKSFFSKNFNKKRLEFNVLPSNPRERDRVNAVNSRLKSADGGIRLHVDKKCRHTIDDFNGVLANDDGSIDKKSSKWLTHITDAIGYYVNVKHPIIEKQGGMIGVVTQ